METFQLKDTEEEEFMGKLFVLIFIVLSSYTAWLKKMDSISFVVWVQSLYQL
jgi:hypothetical protein